MADDPARACVMIIAVDGPTASGKGTIARALAAHFGLPHLDTGLLYRATGYQLLRAGGEPDNEQHALAATSFPESLLDDPELRNETCGGVASRISVHPAVRHALHARQQNFARQPGGAVLDGRDIGTVIAPDADVKLYVTASVEVRAQRRFAEMQAQGRKVTLDAITADLVARDMRDTSRAQAPLTLAPDALLLDTSALNREEAVKAAISLAASRQS